MGKSMTLSCSRCGEEVPEGAIECPACGAGVGTVMFGKKQGLTRTMIGKALELRDAIPWASASAVIMVDDGRGKKKPRLLGLLAIAAVVALLATGGWFLLRAAPRPIASNLPVTEAEKRPLAIANQKRSKKNPSCASHTLNMNDGVK